MEYKNANIISLIKKLIGLLILYSICRLLFFLFNYPSFSEISFLHLSALLFFGIRFDISVIVLSNCIFLLLFLFPFPLRENKRYKMVLKWFFVIINSLAMFANCLDLAYFKYTLKRTTADVFNFFGGEKGGDLGRLLPLFLKDYWYVFILWGILTAAVYYLYKKTENNILLNWKAKQYVYQTIIFCFSIGVLLIGYRGGLQLKPIAAVNAVKYTSVKYIPIVVNTPFTILKTLDVAGIDPKIYFTDDKEITKLYSPYHKEKTEPFKKLNVFVIALESFSKEYIGGLNGRKIGYTPFLDSLMKESFTCTNAFSDGKKSIEGIPAIVASIPTWSDEPYIFSQYGSNQINSLASLLKKQGYYSAFFHGGDNGTMGFDVFASFAGYDNYYGRNEYNNEKDYDGNWGIWDEEFLQYTAKTINTKHQPFFVTLFTLSSHHPYNIPEKYKGKFKDGPLQIEKSISYTDYALRKFFETAKKMPWYNNTLFVLTADHTGVSEDAYFNNRIGNYSIPIIYYMPNSNLKRFDSTTTQHIDIMPSVLDYINYPESYFSFGTSVFDSTANHFALNMNNDVYQFIQNNYTLQFDGEKANDLFNYKKDSLLKTDLIIKNPLIAKQMETKAKAIIQTYQQCLINNKMR